MSTKKKATRKRAAKKPSPKKRKTAKKAAKKPATKKKAAAKKQAPRVGTKGSDHGLKPGQVLERRFKGKDLCLQVTANGFLFDGTEHASLTSAAKAATAYPSVSGVRFWLGASEKGGSK